MVDPKQRFSNRVENYSRYRPSYATAILELLAAECGLTPEAVIADVGSGTGIMTKLFLENGNTVVAVEPNAAMRQAAEEFLADYPNFLSVAAEAEATTLAAASADFVVAAQSFHWFDHERARHEFVRILKPNGWVVLVWNERRIASTPFIAGYEELVRGYSTDYSAVDHRKVTVEVLHNFFMPDEFESRALEYSQTLDFDGLKGRLLSSSYAPLAGHSKYPDMLHSLRMLFDAYQVDGQVKIEYDTEVYYGHLHRRLHTA